MSLSEDEHSLSGDMPTKHRWNAWKRMTGVVGAGGQIQHITAAGINDEGHDEGMWDNNDASFLREVAFEHQQHLAPSPSHSDNALEEVSSLAGSSSGHTAAQVHPILLQQGSLSSAFSMASSRRPTSAAGASHFTLGSMSASASDASSALTLPSPGSSKIELNNRNRLSGSKFGSNETSPTTASFTSRDDKIHKYSSDKLRDAWTEEPLILSSRPDDQYEKTGEVILTSLPEEQSPDRYSYSTERRPSAGSLNFGLSQLTQRRPSEGSLNLGASLKNLTKKTSTAKSEGRSSKIKVSNLKSETSPTTDYGLVKTPISAKSSAFTSTKASPNGSPTPTKKSSLVSGLKKKFGGTLRSTGGTKESTMTKATFPTSSPSLSPISSPTRKSSWVESPIPTTDEIQIVSADAMRHINLLSGSSSPVQGSFLSKEKDRSAPSKVHRSDLPLQDSRGDRNKSELSMMSKQAQSPRANDHANNGSVESFSSKLFKTKRSSGLFSHSRNSSRTSIIEHTSFEDARRQSGVYSAGSISSSQYNLDSQRNGYGSMVGSSNDEEREELQGDPSPMTTSVDLPSHSDNLRSPIRPSRTFQESTTSLPGNVGSFQSTRASVESHFNAAHDKRWSTIGDRSGSDVGLVRSRSSRRGSDASFPSGGGGSLRGQGEYRNRDSLNSLRSNRVSWQQNFSVEALVPGRKSSLSAASNASQSKGNRKSLIGSPRWSDMISQPLPRKQSLTGAQISRPTSAVGSSASLAEDIAIGDEQRIPYSPTELIVQKLQAREEKEKQRGIPQPIRSIHPDLIGMRNSKSAGGRVEYPLSSSLQGHATSSENETSSPSPSTSPSRSSFLIQQMAPKRPTFGLEMQPDVAAAFDCIPSPDARRSRTTSTPTLVGLSISGVEDTMGLVGLDAHKPSSRSIFSSATGVEGAEEEEEDEGEEEMLALHAEEEDSDTTMMKRTVSKNAASITSPRPLHPADAPQSPVMDELELLDDEGGNSETTLEFPTSTYSPSSSSSTTTPTHHRSSSSQNIHRVSIHTNNTPPQFGFGSPSSDFNKQLRHSSSFNSPLIASLPRNNVSQEHLLPWGSHARASSNSSSTGILSQGPYESGRRASYSFV